MNSPNWPQIGPRLALDCKITKECSKWQSGYSIFIRFCCSFQRTSATSFIPRSAASTSRRASWCSCIYAFISRRRLARAAASASSRVLVQWYRLSPRILDRPVSHKARRPLNRKNRLVPRWRTSRLSRISPYKYPSSRATLLATLVRLKRIPEEGTVFPWRKRIRWRLRP